MKRLLLGLAAGACVIAALSAQIGPDPEPSCTMCPGTYISTEELQAYTQKAMAEGRTDQQVRDADFGKTNVAIGIVYRGRLDAPRANSVAEHDLVSEVYHVISGSATLMLGPDLVDKQRRPATQETVRLFNGPGNNASSIRNGIEHQIKAGDVVMIPAGTGHQFRRIDDHINYLMVRIDPDKVTPLKSEADSKVYLSTPRATQ